MTRHRILRVLLALAVALALSSCDFSVYKLPLPGGADVGDDPLEVEVVFPDVLDLVPQSTVKVDDVTVGKVTDIDLDGYRARVTLEIRNDVDLSADAQAEIRQTSLLGEKFVSLSDPENATDEKLEDGDTIGPSSTNRNPEVEEVLGALSLVLNGGGVAQLKTISSELNNALEGREGSAKSVLTQLRDFMRQLDDNKAGIVRAIRSLNELSITANNQRKSITTALDELPSALSSLDRQRHDLVKMLRALSKLGNTGTRVIRATKGVTIDALQQLQPVLTELAKSGDDFVNGFHAFVTYPFVDEAVGRDPQVARNLHMGDFVNLEIKLDVKLLDDGDPTNDLPDLTPPEVDPTEVIKDVQACLQSLDLKSKACKAVMSDVTKLTKLVKLCKKEKNRDTVVCRALNLEMGGLNLDLGDLSDLGSVGGLPLGRPGYGESSASIGKLMKAYDPALVAMLGPGVAQ